MIDIEGEPTESANDSESSTKTKAQCLNITDFQLQLRRSSRISSVPNPKSYRYECNLFPEERDDDTDDDELKHKPSTSKKKSTNTSSSSPRKKSKRTPLTELPKCTENRRCVEMRLEASSDNPRMAFLGSCMTFTFKERRKWIEQQQYVNTVLRAYPALGFPEILELEFKLITNVDLADLRAKIRPMLKVYLANKDLLRKMRDKLPLCKNSLSVLRHTTMKKDTTEYEDLRDSVGLLLLWHDLMTDINIDYGEVYRYWNPDSDTDKEIAEEKGGKRRQFPPGPYILILRGKLVGDDSPKRMVINAEHNEIGRSNNFFNRIQHRDKFTAEFS